MQNDSRNDNHSVSLLMKEIHDLYIIGEDDYPYQRIRNFAFKNTIILRDMLMMSGKYMTKCEAAHGKRRNLVCSPKSRYGEPG